MTSHSIDGSALADQVELYACPRCTVDAGSPCRTPRGMVASTYHTGRFILVPALAKAAAVPTPRDRRPGKPWRPGAPVVRPPAIAPKNLPDIRIGYARCSTDDQELAAQLDALKAAGCRRIFHEKVSTRQRTLPKLIEAVEFTEPGDILSVTNLDRLGRDAEELLAAPRRLAERGVRLEMLGGPLPGIYDPNGPGRIVFAVFAAFAEALRDGIREKTLAGLASAEQRGRRGGRPPVVTDDMLTIALKRRAEGQSVTSIAQGLIIPTGANAGKPVSKSALYEALKAYDEQQADEIRRERAALAAAALPELVDGESALYGGQQLAAPADL
ncbi:recombinase family protein [Kitasatospora cineracea]|uniref:DNA invertase Pin-like site-specific DNA recombinase n=1 Tax=Kitasatospora cineracea TaxID=88074 RepID=A0A3N4R0D8_9ACTN|nr:recombinase family protein [Kitasatospora cineracea]RPE26582.1 DNA invertase Pin-like site-specific DNA recombinase [Kitasatospora cineracea]